mmetsp:Transcript_429/g.785  ORF Transcript_429/g.785 Transcript_429/m.785 type:complete len:472 (-) Transcript_429:2885-4300(-)
MLTQNQIEYFKEKKKVTPEHRLTAGGFNSRGTHVYTSVISTNNKQTLHNTRIWRIGNDDFEPKSLLVHDKCAVILAPKDTSNFIAFCKLQENTEEQTHVRQNSGSISSSNLTFSGTSTRSNDSWGKLSGQQYTLDREKGTGGLYETKSQKNDVIVYGIGLVNHVFHPCTSFTTTKPGPILNVVLHSHTIVVVHLNEIALYDNEGEPVFIYKTCDNPLGLVAVAENTIAFPGENVGEVTILKDFKKCEYYKIRPHQNPLAHIALNQSGTYLATASESGTLIQVYLVDKNNTEPIKTFRRGKQASIIYSMDFSRETFYHYQKHKKSYSKSSYVDQFYSQYQRIQQKCRYYGEKPENVSNQMQDFYICVLSGNGTIHFFSINDTVSGYLNTFTGYFTQGVTTHRKQHYATQYPATLTFDEKYVNMIHLFDINGQFKTYVFDFKDDKFKEHKSINLIDIHKKLLDDDLKSRSFFE